ncbi:ABC transporter substrate-binding protein [Paractinoplanes hotanensis]|uniref:ABC transporter substrate-binding protein n=1 Tax=Paractinoplanes hotanensis TaxID=2906497 RepID=A0ABT0YEA5_9ACTN|nr:ABC transporter substrate-binding protein [Actinoplanes hotanensis]MCM4083838.1 ABC transporter substrate-binding protein [Actinoplanes hotanensis]
MLRRTLAGLAATLLLSGAVAGCSGETGDDFAGTTEGEHVARFVQQPWADLVVETRIAMQILDKLGYRTSTQEVSVPLAAEALSTGQADAYLGNWWPSQKETFQPILDAGRVEVTGTILTGTEYAPAVPGYVTEQLGITSLADLDAHGDKFGREILGIEPGSPGNTTIRNAIKADAYGLGDWKLTASSTEAMLAEVERRAAKKQPVAFLGWSPHWMTIQWKLNFLEDPEKVWPGAGQIRVLTRSGLAGEDANLKAFLSQIAVDTATASRWIDQVDKDKQKPEDIAAAWISANPDTVRTWLVGVTTASGEPAADAVLES